MSVTLDLIVIALVALGAAVVCDLVCGGARGGRVVAYLGVLLAGALLGVAGFATTLAQPRTVVGPDLLAAGHVLLRLDGLSGGFVTLSGIITVGIAAASVSWARRSHAADGRGFASGFALLVASMVVIEVAADAFTFLFAWECLTLAFFILIGRHRREQRSSVAAWVTFGAGKLSGAAVLLGMLLLAGATHSLAFVAWHHVSSELVRVSAFGLLVLGFGTKVGLVPFEVWMPAGYPAAPGPLRAALAGLGVNAGFYGLWRTLALLGTPPVWLAAVVLIVGGVTALLGVTFGAVQARLTRLVAYSSVENAGLITVGFGVALAGRIAHDAALIALGLLAASLQLVAHAFAKSALFSASTFAIEDWRSDDLDDLRGVYRTHPRAALGMALGSIVLAGMPPTLGFVSEWFVLESLMQEFRLPHVALRLAMGIAGALVALTSGIAALTFARLIGLTILRRPERALREPARDPGWLGTAGVVLLGGGGVVLAGVAPWLVRFTADALAPLVAPQDVRSALAAPWVLQPVFPGFSVLSPSWLSVELPIALVVVVGLTLALSRGRWLRVRRVPAWRSATAGVSGADHYSSFGYANVLRHVLGNLLGSRRELVVVAEQTDAGVVEATGVEARSVVVEPVEASVYRGGRRALLGVGRAVRRLQSGRLDAYVAYMLLALVAVLIAVAVV